MNTPIEDYINYRIKRADESFEEARLLAKNESWNATINRLYYSCFYAATAILTKNGIESKTHAGTRTQFFQNFIKTELVNKEYSKLYSDLFDWRLEGDYGDFSYFDKETVLPLFNEVDSFIARIKELL